MRGIEDWFAEYEKSHQHSVNRNIHKVAVPTILLCILGLLAAVPLRGEANLAWVVAPCYLVFALVLNRALGLGLALTLLCMMEGITAFRAHTNATAFVTTWLGLFVFAWVLQFVGHHIEKRKPSFVADLAFLLIGPLWTLSLLYTHLGLNWHKCATRAV